MRTILSYIFSFYIIYSFHLSILFSQNWRHYTVEDGLIGNSIWQIIEDKKGYLWIRTAFEGVSRFDGLNFDNYNTSKGIISDNINYVLPVSDGSIWFCTDRGLSKFTSARFYNLDEKDGLSSNYINSALEDINGNLWFATDKGVSVYDGAEMRIINLSEGHSEVAVISILEDCLGKLWFGTEKGLFNYDDPKFKEIPTLSLRYSTHLIFEDSQKTLWFAADNGLYRKSIKDTVVAGPLQTFYANKILEDGNQNLWIGTQNHGVWKKSKGDDRFFKWENLVDNTILSMLEDCRGNLWFGTDRGIFKYNQDSIQTFREINVNVLNFVTTIWEDCDENIWFGTAKGLFKYTANNLVHFTQSSGLLDNQIKLMVEDREGTLWLGSEKGLIRYDGKSFYKTNIFNKNIGSILIDRNGNRWIGTTQGVYKNSNKFLKIPTIKNSVIREMLEDKFGYIWFATGEGMIRYDGNNYVEFSIENGKDAIVDKLGNIWVGTWNNGVYKITPKAEVINYGLDEGIASNHIHWILQSRDGNIWFGLKSGSQSTVSDKFTRGGICVYNGNSFKNFSSDSGLPSDFIVAATEDLNGNIWCASDKGIFRLIFKDSIEIRSFTKDNGLISDYITSIHSDKNGNLWFGSDKGVSKYDNANFHNISLKKFLNISFIESLFEDSYGNMWFLTTEEGIFKYLPPVKQIGPRIHIVQIEADEIYTDNFQNLRIPSDERVSFEYKGISLKQKSDRLRYTHFLEGINQTWTSSSPKTRIYYENLDPGNYTLKIKAIDEDLIYSHKPAKLNFIAYEPFYKSKIFYSLSIFITILFITAVGYFFNQMRKHRKITREFQEKLRKQEEAEYIQTAKMASLRQLVAGVAHEMNNPLGALSGINDVSSRALTKIENIVSVDSLLNEKNKDQVIKAIKLLKTSCETTQIASNRVTKIVKDLRRFVRLDESEWQTADINQSIENALILLESEIREGIEIKKYFNKLPKLYCSPSNLNQVFLTILKNAIEAISGNGEIQIRTKEAENYIQIDIEDNGIGISPENLNKIFDPGFTTKGVKIGIGLGLSICHKIIVDDHKGHINVRSEPGKGTTFTIHIPTTLSDSGRVTT